MKIAKKILEYVGDGKFEKVTSDNFGHLEQGDYILSYRGEPNLKAEFLGWVKPNSKGKKVSDDEVDPDKVNLLFKDSNGDEFEVYHHNGNYVVGSSADPIKVKAI